MNAKKLLESLLLAGRSLTEQGKNIAESQLNIPEKGEKRDAMLSGMGKGALATGALALLLGTKTGRSVTGGALKIGSLAALGGLAYKAYQHWQGQENAGSDIAEKQPQNLENLSDDEANVRSQKLLQAVIAAAKADRHIDDAEREVINAYIEKLGESSSLTNFIQSELEKPLNPAEIAENTEADGLASEIYLISKIIINEANFMEKAYLGELAKALRLDEGLIAQLDAQAGTL